MELSCERVSARLQAATAGHARLVLIKTVPFFCSSLYPEKKTHIHVDASAIYPIPLVVR